MHGGEERIWEEPSWKECVGRSCSSSSSEIDGDKTLVLVEEFETKEKFEAFVDLVGS